jgi:DNA-binding CsgD family transcriptional regulator
MTTATGSVGRASDHPALLEARAAHSRAEWAAAYQAYLRAEAIGPMTLDDLDAYATTAWRLGHSREAVRLAERVYGQLVRRDPATAATKAVDIALEWLTRGDLNIAQGWMNRARRLLTGAPTGPTHCYLAYLDVVLAVAEQDPEELARRAEAVRHLCDSVEDPALESLSLVSQAIAALHQGRVADGYALVDEALLPLLAGHVRVEWAGDIYCVVLNLCHKLADHPRMRAWTQSMERWCDVHSASPFYRVCDVHRLQLAAADDDYRRLEDQLFSASTALEDVNSWVGAEGFYQLGEVRRLRGDTEGALAAFAKARSLGKDPQPGEALLHCSVGQSRKAWTDLRVALAGAGPLDRMRLLRAAVVVALARDDIDEAQRHCDQLAAGAEAFATPGYRGWAAHARGAVLVRRGEFEAALDNLGAALREYRLQQERYDIAEVYEWMALAHRGLGDDTAADTDIATAENIYEQLAVQPSGVCGRASPGGLTRREIEVLRAIAGGATNRQVAHQFVISDKTVGRHLANIYTKLGVSSRTAAVTWAHQNGVVRKDN